YQQALKVLREAEDLARGLDDQRRLGWVIAYQAHMYMSSGVPDRAVELGERARAIGEALGDSALQAQANMYAGGALRDQGSYTRAIDCLRWSLAQLRAKTDSPSLATARRDTMTVWTWLATSLAHRGEFAEAIALCEEAARVAEGMLLHGNLLHADLGLG